MLPTLGLRRHNMFLDTAVACPAAGGALNAGSAFLFLRSAEASGVAASLRAEEETAKYASLAAGVSSQFRPAVVERFGACCDPLVGLINMLSCRAAMAIVMPCEPMTIRSRHPRARPTWRRY